MLAESKRLDLDLSAAGAAGTSAAAGSGHLSRLHAQQGLCKAGFVSALSTICISHLKIFIPILPVQSFLYFIILSLKLKTSVHFRCLPVEPDAQTNQGPVCAPDHRLLDFRVPGPRWGGGI